MGQEKFGSNDIKTHVCKFDLRAIQLEPNASAVSLGSQTPDNKR